MNTAFSHDPEAFQRARRSVIDFLDDQLVPLGELARLVAAEGAEPAAGDRLTEEQLQPIVPRLTAVLEESDYVVGHGFVAAPDAVQGRERYLLWMQKRGDRITELHLNLDPGDPDLYDYLDMEWFTRARDREMPAVFGPYVDYAGADLVVLTAAVPIFVDQRFLGVAGCDLLADAVELRIVQLLRGLPGDAIVVNADRSVVAANSARWLPGERLPVHPINDRGSYVAVGSLGDWAGWVLAVAAPER